MCTEITLERLAHFVPTTGHLSRLPLNDHVNQQMWSILETRRLCLYLLLGAFFPFLSRHPPQMAQSDSSSRQEALDQKHANSYRNLENARKAAAKKKNYDTHKTQAALADIFRERFGNNPYDWQLDVAEAIILGLDSIVIASTGSDKRLPID